MVKLTQEFVDAALELADNGQSKINERERELFGLSSPRLKALLNNLCSLKGTNYLELGVYRGATLISAVYGNPGCKAVGIDNYKYDEREPKRWAAEGDIWHNMKSQLEANLERYSDPNLPVDLNNISIIQNSFEDVDWSTQPKFNVVFFDITPTSEQHYDAFFEKVLPSLSSESVVVFSNYSNQKHAKELDAALIKHADKVEIQWRKQRVSGGLSDATQYYSGIAIVGLKKSIVKVVSKTAKTDA
jgi:hypothetical protein